MDRAIGAPVETTRLAGVREDLVAGLTVALVGLPQCLAYALVAGVPPAYGLSTAVIAGLVAAAAGRTAQVVTGPTNLTALLVSGALFPFLGPGGLFAPAALPALATLTLLAGVVRLVAAAAGGAQLVRFLPQSVLTGFTAGAGILIGAMQLDEALGLEPVHGSGLASQLSGVVAAAGNARPASVAVAAATAAAILAGRKWAPRFPSALVAVTATAVLAWGLGLGPEHGLPLVLDRGAVPAGWPPGALPSLDPALLVSLIGPASAIALLGTLELAVTAGAGGARPDLRRELTAQGLANVAGAFGSGFPASASLTRSALLRVGGARTRAAAALGAAFTLPMLFAGAELVGHIPLASLAGVLLVTAGRMIDRTAVLRLWRASVETRALLSVSVAATLLLPLEWAIFVGTGIGLVIHLARTSAPRLSLLAPAGEGFAPVPEGSAPPAVVLEVSGDLHYAAVPPFADEAERLVPPSARAVVVDLSHAHQLRYAAIRALEAMAERVERGGGRLVLAGVSEDLAGMLRRSGSALDFVAASAEPGASARRALVALGAAGGVAAVVAVREL
jgi:SulP family sulfate permease